MHKEYFGTLMCINKLEHRMNMIRCKSDYKDIY